MADTSSSSYSRVNADGSTTFVFPGGAELPLTPNGAAPAARNSIRFLNETTGDITAQLTGSLTISPLLQASGTQLQAQLPGTDRSARISLNANQPHPDFDTDDPRQVAVRALAISEEGTESCLIIDGAGNSEFVRYTDDPFLGTRGIASMEFDGASLVADVAVPHGLPTGPAIALMTGRGDGADLFYSVAPLGALTIDDDWITFAAQLVDIDPDDGIPSGTYTFSWIALP